MLAIKSYDDWSPTNEETDPLRKLSTYTDYVRSSYYKEGQLSPENEKSIEDGVRQKMLDDGLLKSDTSEDDTQQILAQVLAPQKNTQADARFVFNHLQNEDDADFSGAVPETVSTLARYLSLKANGSQYADELQPAVDDILSDAPLVKRAKISAVDRSEYSVVGVDREDGGRDLYTGPTADPNKLRGEIDSLLGSGALSSADLSKVDGYMAPINGGLSNQSELNRSQVYNDIVNKKIKADPELSDWVNSDVQSRREAIESEQRTTGESVFDVAKNVVTYPFIKSGELVYDYLSGDMFEDKAEPKYAKDATLAQIVASDPVISKRFSTQEIEKFADNYTTTAVGPVFRADRPETGLGADRLGNPMVSIELVSSRKLFDAAIEKAPLTDDQKATASIVRETLFEANRPKLLAFVLEQDSDAVGGLATALAEGKTESEFLEGWLSDDNNYSGTMARVKQFGAGAFKTLFADIPLGVASLAGNEWSAKALSYLDKQQQDRAQFSKMFGDEYGVSFQVLNALPQVGRDILLTVGVGAAGGALKTLVKAERMTSAVALGSASKAAFAGVDDVAAAAIKNASVVGGEKGLGTAFNEAGRSLASKFGPNAPLFITSFTSSATSSFGSIYNQLPENMTHEEKYKAAIGSALYSGLSTSVITVGMSLLGRAGVEAVGSRKIRALMAGEDEAALIAAGNKVIPVNKLNFRQAKGVYESLYNEGKAMGDAAFNRVARAAISGTYKNFLRTSLNGGLNEAVEEMLDQGIQMKLQDAALDRDTPMSEKVNEMFMTGVVSAGLGGIISSGVQLAPLSKSDKSLMLESRASALNNIYTQLRKTNSNLTAEALQRNMDDANTKLRESLKQDALKQEQEKASKAEKDNTKAVADPTEKEYNPADLTAKPVALETFMEAFFRVPAAPTVDDVVEDTDVLDDFIGERVTSNGRYGILKLNEDDSVSLVEKNGYDLNLGQRYRKAGGLISFDKKIMATAEGVPFLTTGTGKDLAKFALPPQLEGNSQIEKKYDESGKLVQLKLLKSPLLSDQEVTTTLIVDNPYQIREVLEHYGIDFVRQSQIKPDQVVETPVVEEPVVETPVDSTPFFLKGLIDKRDTAIEKQKEILAKVIELDTAPEGETNAQKKEREKSNRPIVDRFNQEVSTIEDDIKQLRSSIRKYSPSTIEMGEQGVKFVAGADPISMFTNMEESSQDPEVKLAASQAGNLLTLLLDTQAEESILNVLFTGDPTRTPFKEVAESLSLEQLGQLNLAAESLHNWAATNELSTSTLSPSAISFAGLETETQELDVLKPPTSEQKEARKIPNAIRSMAFTEAQRIRSRVGFALDYKLALEQPAEADGIFGPEESPVTFEPKTPMFELNLALNNLENLVAVDAVGTPANRITQTTNVLNLISRIPNLPDRPELRRNLKTATKEINKALAAVRKAYTKITDEDVVQYVEYLEWVRRSFKTINSTYAPPEKKEPRVRPIKGIPIILADDQFRIEPESEAFLGLVNGGFSITDLQGLGERLTQRYTHPTLGLQPLFSQSRLDLVEKGKEYADPRPYIKSKTAYLKQQVLEKYPATDWKKEDHTTRTSKTDNDQEGKRIAYPVKEVKKGFISYYIFTNDYNITRAQLNADGSYPIKVPASFDRTTLNPALEITGDVVTGYKEPTSSTVYAGGEHRPNNTNSTATILDSKSDSFSKESDDARAELFGTILFEQAPRTPYKSKKREAYNADKERVDISFTTRGGRANREISKATQEAYDEVFSDLNNHIENAVTNRLSTLTGFSGRKFNHLTVGDAVNVIRLATHQKVEEHKLAHFLLNAVSRSVSLASYRLESDAQKTLEAYRDSIGMPLSELPTEVRNALIKETLESVDVDNVDVVKLFKRAYPSMGEAALAKLVSSAYTEIKGRSPNRVLNVFAKSLISRAIKGDLRSLPNKETVNKIATTVANRFDKQQKASRDDVANAASISQYDDLSITEGQNGIFDTTPLDNLAAVFSAGRRSALEAGTISEDELSLLTEGLSASPLSYFSLDSNFLDLGLERLSLLENSVQDNPELRDVFQRILEEYDPTLSDPNQEAIQRSDPQLRVGGAGIVSRLINTLESDQKVGSEKMAARAKGFLSTLSKTDYGTRAAGLLISLGYFPPLKTDLKYLTSGVLFPAETANIGTEAQRKALENLEGGAKTRAAQELRLEAETGFTSDEAAEYYRLRNQAIEATREELIVLNRTTNRAARVQDALQNRKREVFRELSLFIDAVAVTTSSSNIKIASLLLTGTDAKAIAAQATVKENLLKYLEIDIGLTLRQIDLHQNNLISSEKIDDEGAYYAIQDESRDRLDYLEGKLDRLRAQEADVRAHEGGFNSVVSNLIVRLSQYSEGQEQVDEIVNGVKTKLRADLKDKADQLLKANDYKTVVAMAQLHPSVIEQTPADQRTDVQVIALQRITKDREAAKQVEKQLSERYAALIGELTDKGWTVDSNNKLQYPTENIAPVSAEEQKQRYDDIVNSLQANGWILSEVGQLIAPNRFTTQPQEEAQLAVSDESKSVGDAGSLRRLDFSDSQDQQQFALAQEATQIATDLNLYGTQTKSTPKGKDAYKKYKSDRGVSFVKITPDVIITPVRTAEEESAARVRELEIYEGRKLEPYELKRMKAQGDIDLETLRTGALPPEYDWSTYGDVIGEQAAKVRATIEKRTETTAARKQEKARVDALFTPTVNTSKGKVASDVNAKHRADAQSQSTLDPQLRDAAIASNNREKDSLGLVSGDSDSVINALRIIAKTGTQTHRKLAQLLLLAPDYIRTISFNIVAYNSDSAGLYDPEENSVTINLREHNGRGLADVLLHEYAHAITHRIILNPETVGQRVAVDRITRIRELAIIQAKAKGLYGNRTIQMGLKNNSELLAYALTAQEFKVLFNGLTPNGERSLFTRIVDAIMQLFGVSDNNPELANALEELFDFTKMSLAHFHTYNVSAARDLIALDAAMDSDRDSYRTHYASELQVQATLARANDTRFMRTEAEPVETFSGTGSNPNKIDPIYEMERILPDGITLELDNTLAGALGVRRSKPNTIIVNPDIFQNLGRGLSAANGRAAVRTALDEELAHIAADAEFSEQDYEDLASEMSEDMLIAIADLNYANMQPDFAARQALIAEDRKSGVLSNGNIAAEFVRMRITEISKGRVREEDLAFLYTNPNVLERFLAGLKAYIAKLRQLFSSSPTTATASKISMAAREFRKISNGGVTPQPEPSIAGDLGDTTHFLNALNGDIVEGQQDRVEFQLPVDTTGDPSRIADFWKAAENKMYDLPSTLRQIVNKRNAALAKHQYSMKELAKLFPKLRDQALDSGILIEDIGILFGTTAPQISKIARRDIEKQVREFRSSNKSDDATVSAANDVAANKLKQTLVDAAASVSNAEFLARQQAMEESVRRSGHGELVDLVVDFRNEINKTKEQIKFDDSNNVYLTRSYRFYQSEGWALATMSGGLTEIDGQVVDFDKLRLAATSHFVSVVESKAKEEGKTLTPDERDQLTMVALDKYLAELQQESEDNKKFAKDFTGLKNVRRDIDRLLQKHDIDKPLRELLGEVTDPLENAVRTLYSVGRLAANDKFLRTFAKAAIDLGLASKTPKQGMVVPFFAKDANELNEFAGLYVTENIAAALKNELSSRNPEHETRSQSIITGVGKVLSVASGVAMTTKTIGGVGFYPRNILGGIMLTTAQGIANPLNARKALRLSFLANSAVLADSDEEQRQQVRRLVELQIVRDDTSGRVTTDLLRGFVTNTDDQLDELVTELMKAQETGKTDKLMSMLKSPLKTGASAFFKAADIGAALNNITDSAFKVNAYLYELSVLQEAYGDSVALSTLEVRAARKVKAVFPTHSDQISFAKTFNRSPYSMVVMPFIRWKSEVMRTMFNTIPLAMEEINSGNSVEVGRGVKRLVGFFSTVTAAPFLVGSFFSLLFAALSGDDDDDKNRALTDEEEATLRLGLPQWQRNNNIFTRLVGGKVQVVNLTNITPYALLTDMVSIIARGASNGNFDIQGLASYFTGEVVGSNIAFNAVDQARRNENEFGDPIVTENDDALQSSLKILGHLGKGIVVPSAYGFLEKATRFGEQDRGIIVAGELTGARPMQHDLSDIERRAMFNVKNQLDESVAILRPIYSNRAVPLDDIPVLVTDHQDSLNKTQTNFTKIIAGLKSLGSNTQSLAKSAKAVGLSQQRLFAAAAGRSLSWRPNGEALNKIRFNKGQGEEQDYASVQEALLDAVSKKPAFYSSTSDD